MPELLGVFYVHLHPHEGTFDVAGARRATADGKMVVQEEAPTPSGPRRLSAGAVAAVSNSKLQWNRNVKTPQSEYDAAARTNARLFACVGAQLVGSCLRNRNQICHSAIASLSGNSERTPRRRRRRRLFRV